MLPLHIYGSDPKTNINKENDPLTRFSEHAKQIYDYKSILSVQVQVPPPASQLINPAQIKDKWPRLGGLMHITFQL